MFKLANPVRRVHRLHDGAQGIDGEPGDRQFGHVRLMDDHHVATPNARICEPGSEALNVRLERLVCQRPIRGKDGGAVGRADGTAIDPIAQRFVTPPALGAEIRRIENGHRRPPTTIGWHRRPQRPASTRDT
jgi:hypothetical protein